MSPGGYFAHPGRPAPVLERFGPDEEVRVVEVYDGYRGWQKLDGLVGEVLSTGLVRRLWADGYDRVMVSAAARVGQWNLDVRALLDADPGAQRGAP